MTKKASKKEEVEGAVKEEVSREIIAGGDKVVITYSDGSTEVISV